MKKIALVLIAVMLFPLCACSDENTINNTNTSSNPNISSSNTTSIKDDFTLPERDDPTNPTTSNNSTNNNNSSFNQYHDQDDASSQLTVQKRLHLEVEKPYYKSSTIMINLILHSDNGTFNYYTDFFLQKYENGKWEYHTTKNDTIDYKFNIASSDSNVAFVTYDLRKLYTMPLPTGTYRFIQESDNGKMVSNSFEIVDNILSNEEQPMQ